jgi:ElaB/YqjD/DUF883 family membrane-anchored ribosome-binding protein
MNVNAKTGAVDSSLKHGAQGDNEGKQGVTALRESKDKLLLDLKAVVDDAQALMKEAADVSSESVAGVPAYLEDRFNAVKGNLQQAKNAMQAKAKYAAEATDSYVRENPWKSMGFATAASVIASILIVGACLPTMRKTLGGFK